MRALSATEAINPAIDRTKSVLFKPFRKGRSWKLAATAYLCRMGTMYFPFPLIYLMFIPAAASTGNFAVIALICGVVLATVVWTLLFHLTSRLQFAYFDIVLTRGQFVAPAWRKYGAQALPWTTLKIVVGTAATLVCALPIAAYIRHLLPLIQALQRPGQPPPPQLFFALFAGYGLIFLVFGPVYLVSSLLCDFMIPTLALEDTGIGEAFRRTINIVRREPGQFALYTLLKVVLGFAAYMGAIIAAEIVIIFVTLILALIAAFVGWLLHLVGIPTAVLSALALFLSVIWYGFVFAYGLLLPIGAILTFLDAYALYFFGGRYQILGDILEPPPPPLPQPPPLPFTPA